jgi:hypothetical protein
MTESQAEDLAVEITKLFIPLDIPDTLGSINFAEKASEVMGILIGATAQTELIEALQLLKEDFADSEGCYCGQVVGGTKDGEPLGICGYCKADAALAKACGTANEQPPGPQAPAGGQQKTET